jgi:hypothetical protein
MDKICKDIMEDIPDDLEEELEEPYKTLYCLLDEIDVYDGAGANEFHHKFDEILWNPEEFEKLSQDFIPSEFSEMYSQVREYVQDANLVELDVILNTQSRPFGLNIAKILDQRIRDMTSPLESDEKNKMIQAFMWRVCHMAANEEIWDEDIPEMFDLICKLRTES